MLSSTLPLPPSPEKLNKTKAWKEFNQQHLRSKYTVQQLHTWYAHTFLKIVTWVFLNRVEVFFVILFSSTSPWLTFSASQAVMYSTKLFLTSSTWNLRLIHVQVEFWVIMLGPSLHVYVADRTANCICMLNYTCFCYCSTACIL